MALIVEAIVAREAAGLKVRARYGERTIVVHIKTDQVSAGQAVLGEIAITRVVAWQKSAEPSGIYDLAGGQHRLVGEIHGDMALDDGSFLYDLYLSPGPDYFAIDSTDIEGATLKVGERVAVDVEGLCFHPVNT